MGATHLSQPAFLNITLLIMHSMAQHGVSAGPNAEEQGANQVSTLLLLRKKENLKSLLPHLGLHMPRGQ